MLLAILGRAGLKFLTNDFMNSFMLDIRQGCPVRASLITHEFVELFS
jgi:hypothetical protein